MGGQTDAGLRYPTAQDLMADTNVHINNLKSDIDFRLANIPLVARTVSITTNPAGDVTVPVPDFAVLRGVVCSYKANYQDLWSIVPFLTVISAGGFNLRVWYQDRTTAGYSVHPFVGTTEMTYIAWGTPR